LLFGRFGTGLVVEAAVGERPTEALVEEEQKGKGVDVEVGQGPALLPH
jgi:hypothetical protein